MKKLIEKLKNMKKRNLLIIGGIALVLIVAIVITVVILLNREDPADPGEGTETESETVADSTVDDPDDPGEEEEPTVPTVEINAEKYVVIYDDKATNLVKDITTKWVEKSSKALGIDLAVDMDNEWNTPQAKEILVGLSNRDETKVALEKTAGKFTYNVSIIGEKICVAAPTPELIEDALDYLYDTWISKSEGDGKFPLEENISHTPQELEHVTMIDNGNCLFNVVYPKGATVGTPVSVAAIEIRDFLQKYTNEGQEVALLGDYANSQGQFDLLQPSVVVGNTEYPRSEEISANQPYFTWQMEYLDNQFYLYCEDVASTKVLLAEMKDLMSEGVYLDGSKTIRVRVPEAKSGYYADWCKEIPEYVPVEGEKGVYMDAISEFTEGYFRIYLNKVTKAGYESYMKTLEDAGYEVYQENSVANKDNVSYFTTLTGEQTVLHVYYLAHQKALRILVCEKDTFVPYATEAEEIEKVGVPTLTVMDMEYIRQGAQDNGLGLIFTLTDGSYVIYDGGYSYDTEKLYNYLKDNNQYGDKTKIHIRAWVLTHPHLDHYGNYIEFAKNYGSNGTVVLENAVYQFDYEGAMNPNMTSVGEANAAVLKDILTEVDIATKQFIGAKRLVPMAGQILWFGDLGIEIMATSEMLYPTQTTNQNDHSMITRVHLAGDTFLITGDTVSAPMHMKTLERVYGTNLESKFMTAPHHGLNGSDSFFLLVRPEYVIFHTETDDYLKRISNEGGIGCNMTLVDQLKQHELFEKGEAAEDGFVKEFIVADEGEVNGYHVLRLPFMGSDYYESNFGNGNYDDNQDVDNWEDLVD